MLDNSVNKYFIGGVKLIINEFTMQDCTNNKLKYFGDNGIYFVFAMDKTPTGY